jgi:hypothetical protein
MLEDLTLTKKERDAIKAAFSALRSYTRSDCELNDWAKKEQRGYGNRNDAIPLICAKALLVEWFLHGVHNPEQLLRDTFNLRPAAVYFEGLGAHCLKQAKITDADLIKMLIAKQAYEAAFARMHERDVANLNKYYTAKPYPFT